MKILYLILARGGSKRLPKKNIKLLKGKPLICYTIDSAIGVTSADNIYVSTDDDQIINVVENYGIPVPFKRPSKLATDEASSEEVIFHAINFYEKKHGKLDTVVLLQPTSPLRTTKHLKEALTLYNKNINMVVSVTKEDVNLFTNTFKEIKDGFLNKLIPDNLETTKVYKYNGAIYIINVDALKKYKKLPLFDKIVKYEMDKTNSIDIDELSDWLMAEQILENKLNT